MFCNNNNSCIWIILILIIIFCCGGNCGGNCGCNNNDCGCGCSVCGEAPFGASQRIKKVLADFFARFKNAMFFVKLHFTKNLAALVKKSD